MNKMLRRCKFRPSPLEGKSATVCHNIGSDAGRTPRAPLGIHNKILGAATEISGKLSSYPILLSFEILTLQHAGFCYSMAKADN